ncbi:MAG TPA: sulfate adenylyltransferase subunit CysD [Bacteroidia bacterium]|nr:sulfate adenylyltransferase subunit CysD [Bacteroidia bacterium]HNU32293.1 sulfate adenylyltransferase subunit CysD [Bacteroidia bacterium]
MIFYNLNHLRELESEAIHVLREAAANFNNLALLFSGGKDSIVLTHLARKAFYPARIPFPLLHIDTGHNFPETLLFRDSFAEKMEVNLLIRHVDDTIKSGRVVEETGINASRNSLQTTTLLDAIEEFQLEACIGGARRDEEKARAKERFFSHRNSFGEWEPKNQRPELWSLFNARKQYGEHFRIFPLSNWTELDVWQYISMEKINIPNIYFSHERECILRNNMIIANSDFLQKKTNEPVEKMRVRYRTVGDMTCTGAMISYAASIEEIILEIAGSNTTERGTRHDDKRSEAAMEERKRQGYF